MCVAPCVELWTAAGERPSVRTAGNTRVIFISNSHSCIGRDVREGSSSSACCRRHADSGREREIVCLWNTVVLLYTCHCPAGAVEDAVQTLLPGQQSSGVGAWSSAIGDAFLQPYGLNADASTFTATGTSGSVHQAVSSLPQDVAVYRYNSETGNRCEVLSDMWVKGLTC